MKLLLLALLLCCCFPCVTGKAGEKNKAVILIKEDPAPVNKAIANFLQWYKVNLHKANSFRILIKDGVGNFMVDKKAVTAYLNFIKSSKCLSDKYIGYWQTYFDDKAIQLKKDKTQSDIPEGFDMDFVLITQEPEIVLDNVGRLKFKTVSMNSTVALIGVKLPSDNSVQYEFEMYKTKEGWRIGYISTPNYD